VGGQGQLVQVVGALHPVGGRADFLDRGQEQADQDRNDRDHDQQLNEREALTGTGVGHGTHLRKKIRINPIMDCHFSRSYRSGRSDGLASSASPNSSMD
jgi:hypothetical protein